MSESIKTAADYPNGTTVIIPGRLRPVVDQFRAADRRSITNAIEVLVEAGLTAKGYDVPTPEPSHG